MTRKPALAGFGPVVVFAVALAIRLGAIAVASPMPNGDGYDRLAHTDALVVHDWLPLYQAALDAAALVSRDLGWLRAVNASIGAVAAAAFAAVCVGELGPIGILGGLALALSPIHAWTAAALYQEPLFVACLCGGLAALERRPWLAVACLAAASLCRYEAWLLVALVGGVLLARRPRPWAQVAALAAAPTAWLVWRVFGPRGADGGFATWLDVSVAPSRFLAQARVLRGLVPYWIGWPVVAAAAIGLFAGRRVPGGRVTGLLLAFGVLDVLFVTVARPYAPPDNARQLHVLVLVAALFACRALLLLPGRGRWFGAAALLAAFVVPSVRVADAARGWDPGAGVAASAAVGAALATQVTPDDRVLVLDPGTERFPGEEPADCLAVMAYAGLFRARVVCDTEVPVDSAEGLAAWMASERVRWVVWPVPDAEARPVAAWVATLAAAPDVSGVRSCDTCGGAAARVYTVAR